MKPGKLNILFLTIAILGLAGAPSLSLAQSLDLATGKSDNQSKLLPIMASNGNATNRS